MFCFQWAEIDMKSTCDCSPAKSSPWLDFLFSAKWDCWSPKPQPSWQVRINNCIFFFSFLTCSSNNSPSTPYALGMKCLHLPLRAKCYCWSRGSVSCYRQLHPLGGIVPLEIWCQANQRGSSEDHSLQDLALLIWSDRIPHKWSTLTAQTRNLYGIRAGRKTTNKWLKSRSYNVYRLTRKPHWLPTTAVSAKSGHGGGRTWQWLIGRIQLNPVDGWLKVYLVSNSSTGANLMGSKVVVWYTSGELFTVVPNRLLSTTTDTLPVSYIGAFCEIP